MAKRLLGRYGWYVENFGNTNQTDTGDYDGDRMPNLWEYTWDFCPTNAADAMQDYDGDGYFNVYECKHDYEFRGRPYPVHFFYMDEATVWGATAKILLQLLQEAFGWSGEAVSG